MTATTKQNEAKLKDEAAKKAADSKKADKAKAEAEAKRKADAEAKAKAAAKAKPAGPEIPGVESVTEIMEAEGCSENTATKIRAGKLALAREKAFRGFAKKRKDQAHYLCTATRAHGYMRIGRRFELGETLIFADELTEAQREELESSLPEHLRVVKVGFPKEAKPEAKTTDKPDG